MGKPDRTPTYAGIKTVAYELDCSEKTVQEYVKRGLLPGPRQIGGIVRWKWSEVLAKLDGLPDLGEQQALEIDKGTENQAPTVDPIMQKIHGRRSQTS
jgi:predicted DNA-binding transcriptional regulator AlpA